MSTKNMKNALSELLEEIVRSGSHMIAAEITITQEHNVEYIVENGEEKIIYKDENGTIIDSPTKTYTFYKESTHEEQVEFLKKLDFFYDIFGSLQYVTGTIWYNDGTWSVRRDDKMESGTEWWEHIQRPVIPTRV